MLHIMARIVCLLSLYVTGGFSFFIAGTDPQLEWTGRRILSPEGTGFTIDWEGTRVRATVCNASSVNMLISDTTRGGGRFGVWVNDSSSVHPVNAPNLRVATFFTAEGQNMTYALTQRSMYFKKGVKEPGCFTYTGECDSDAHKRVCLSNDPALQFSS